MTGADAKRDTMHLQNLIEHARRLLRERVEARPLTERQASVMRSHRAAAKRARREAMLLLLEEAVGELASLQPGEPEGGKG